MAGFLGLSVWTVLVTGYFMLLQTCTLWLETLLAGAALCLALLEAWLAVGSCGGGGGGWLGWLGWLGSWVVSSLGDFGGFLLGDFGCFQLEVGWLGVGWVVSLVCLILVVWLVWGLGGLGFEIWDLVGSVGFGVWCSGLCGVFTPGSATRTCSLPSLCIAFAVCPWLGWMVSWISALRSCIWQPFFSYYASQLDRSRDACLCLEQTDPPL